MENYAAVKKEKICTHIYDILQFATMEQEGAVLS